jgi:hypothetical protein
MAAKLILRDPDRAKDAVAERIVASPRCECARCRSHHRVEDWRREGMGRRPLAPGPRQVDRLWILDVDGGRLVIDAFSMPSATAE